ncbi:MAG: HD-GYP domain-containing protein [Candidatus Hydrothermia bacterium]
MEVALSQIFESLTYKAMEEEKSLKDVVLFARDRIEKSLDLGKSAEELIEKEIQPMLSQYMKNTYESLYIAIIDTSGLVRTPYNPYDSLNIKNIPNLWSRLKSLKTGETYFVPVNITSIEPSPKSYIYTKLKDGRILVIFGKFSTSVYTENANLMRNISIYLDRVAVFNQYKKFIFGFGLTEFPKKITTKHPYITEVLKTVVFHEIPQFNEPVLLYLRLNFFSIFSVLIVTLFAYLLALLSIEFAARRVYKVISGDLKKSGNLLLQLTDSNLPQNLRVDEFKTAEIYEAIKFLLEITQKIREESEKNRSLYIEFKESFYDFSEKLATIAERFDPDAHNHLKRVKHITRLILDHLELEESYKSEIVEYSVLHDIGKIFIPAEIVTKPGPLTEEERKMVREHTLLAEKLLSHPELKIAREIALYHHENFDGTGYPFGLKGEEIPLPARIVKIANTYDVLRSRRPYKKPLSHSEAMRVFVLGDEKTKPSHFDPQLLSIFLKIGAQGDPYENLL